MNMTTKIIIVIGTYLTSVIFLRLVYLKAKRDYEKESKK